MGHEEMGEFVDEGVGGLAFVPLVKGDVDVIPVKTDPTARRMSAFGIKIGNVFVVIVLLGEEKNDMPTAFGLPCSVAKKRDDLVRGALGEADETLSGVGRQVGKEQETAGGSNGIATAKISGEALDPGE